jgi:large subunit ribosomal protein L15
MFQLNNLKPAPGARRKNKRVGRGPGSGHGKTSTRGSKGHSSRSGGGMASWFEGGQMPLYRRIPKRGFTSPNKIENQIVNLAAFERFDVSREIDLAYLREVGLINGPNPRVKILGNGEINAAFKVRVHAVSQSAREKIEAKGGSVQIVEHGTAGQK